MIKKNKNRIFLILLVLLLAFGLFYWFQFRPVKIRSYCHRQASGKATLTTKKSNLLDAYYPSEGSENKISTKNYTFLYDSCLHEKGLK